jgi:hypothetical protein
MILYVLGGVFGNEADTGGGTVVYGGHGPTDFYTPAYVALAVVGVALISVPTHLVEYREIGVLKRLCASAVRRRAVLASQLAVSLLIATAGVALLLAAAFGFTDVTAPGDVAGFVGAYVPGAISIAARWVCCWGRCCRPPGRRSRSACCCGSCSCSRPAQARRRRSYPTRCARSAPGCR